MPDDDLNDSTTPATQPAPADSAAAETPAAPAKAVRRRRATKAVAPAAEVPSAGGVSDAGDPPGAGPGTAAEPASSAPVLEGGVSAAGETPGLSQQPDAEAAAGEAPAPAKRVRKKAAPRKRAVKAAAAPAETAAPPEVDEALEAAAPGDPVAEAVVEVLESPAEPVVEPVEEDPAVAQSLTDDVVPERLVQATAAGTGAPSEADASSEGEAQSQPDADAEARPEPEAQPAPRTRRRRAPAVVTFQAPEPDADPATEEQPALEATGSGPTDPEPAGEAPAPRRRRRAGTAGALRAADLVPTLLEPATEPAPAVPAAEDAAEELVEAADADEGDDDRPRRRRRGRRGRGPRSADADAGSETETEAGAETDDDEGDADSPASAQGSETSPADDDDEQTAEGTRRRRRRRRRSGSGGGVSADEGTDEVPTVVHVREPRQARVKGAGAADEDGVRGITGSTRMAAKRARRQEGRDSGRRRPAILSEAEFLARREAVDRTMVVRQKGDRTQIAVLEDGVLVEHYVTKASAQAFAGNVYLGKVQNVLPSMEAAFVDIGKGKNGVLYAGEVSYDGIAGGRSRSIEQVLKSGQDVLVQVSKDPLGHKGARLTSQVSLPGRYLVYVPEGSMTGISRKLPENERTRLKQILKKVVPEDAGVIIRTAAEGASEEELAADVRRLQAQWEVIQTKVEQLAGGGAPALLHAEPDLLIRVVRDVFNEDFTSLVVEGDVAWDTIRDYVEFVAPDLAPRLSRHEGAVDVFAVHRIDEQLAKALDRKVWLPSGGSLVVDRTEAMVVIDVNTGKYVGKGGNLEETVTRNNLEAAEEIARQLRLRDLGGIIVVDFIDMVLESNRDLVVRRLVECLGRDRTKHQVAEVTSLGLVQMTRKRVGQGLLESFSEPCEACAGRGVLVHAEPVDARPDRNERFDDRPRSGRGGGSGGGNGGGNGGGSGASSSAGNGAAAAAVKAIAAASLGARAERTAEPAAAGAVATAQPAAAGPELENPEGTGTTGRGRRRRGGRGAGAATVSAAATGTAVAKVEGEDPADQTDDPPVLSDTAPLSEPVQDLADIAPDLVPEIAEQPTPDLEDWPVLPELGSALDAEPQDALPADATAPGEVTAPEQPVADATAVDASAVDASAVDPEPVDLEQEPQPQEAPEVVVVEPDAPTSPRRRRRATSRPAGPPAAD